MAPTPVDSQPAQSTEQPKVEKSWSTGTIVLGSVFLFLALAFIVTIIVFCLRKRAARNKLPPSQRRPSYRPFRTESTDKSGLLENAAPSPEDDKSSMFSRDRGSSVSLYVDTDVVDRRRASMETVNLIPLHVTPAEDAPDPIDRTTSVGSGVSTISRGSSRYSASRSSLAISPQDNGDMGTRGRPRSTSSASMRYYSASVPDVPQVPKIVHTPAQ